MSYSLYTEVSFSAFQCPGRYKNCRSCGITYTDNFQKQEVAQIPQRVKQTNTFSQPGVKVKDVWKWNGVSERYEITAMGRGIISQKFTVLKEFLAPHSGKKKTTRPSKMYFCQTGRCPITKKMETCKLKRVWNWPTVRLSSDMYQLNNKQLGAESLTSQQFLQLVKTLSSFYRIRRFNTAFTTAGHLALSWATQIHSTPSKTDLFNP